MSTNRKITFKEPDSRPFREKNGTCTTAGGSKALRSLPQSVGDQAGEALEGNAAPRRVRCRSPYPHNCLPIEDEPDYLGGALLKRSVSTIKNLGCHRAETDSDSTSDEGDESLQRYKQSLGLGGGTDLSDPNDPRVCIIQSLTMDSPGRDPVVIDLSAPGSAENLKKTPFKIKEGATFTMSAQFKVQHEILSGLHYVQVIKRKGIRIPGGKSDEMIVSNAFLALL